MSQVLSRAHAVLWFENDTFFVKDVKSANGTYVNEERVECDQRKQLVNEDMVRFGTDVVDQGECHRCVVAKVRLLPPGQKEPPDWSTQSPVVALASRDTVNIPKGSPSLLFTYLFNT
jgi:pSer/pThr/pTyr-binding forkhead associated (FHA) protein